MITLRVKGDIKFPKFDLSKELEFVAERIIVPEIAGHIADGTDINGNKYPPLAESTVRMKGHSKPLIGKERRLFSLSTYGFNKAKNRIVIRIKEIRKDIAEYLQIEGVRSKKYGRRYFNFFGVNTAMEKKALNFLRNKINEKIDSAKRK